jgi:hypothetical protein
MKEISHGGFHTKSTEIAKEFANVNVHTRTAKFAKGRIAKREDLLSCFFPALVISGSSV